MSKKEIQEKKEESLIPITVDSQKKELEIILPQAESGTVLATVQIGDSAIRVPLPWMPRNYIKAIGLKNRSVFEVGSVKIGVDVV